MTPDITIQGLLIGLFLFVFPIMISWKLKMFIVNDFMKSFFRMVIQLALIGVFIEYLFDLDNPFVTIAWLSVMLFFATATAIKGLKKTFFVPILISFTLSVFFTLAYFNAFIVGVENLFDVRLSIAIGGMLLGNSMRGVIFGINDFYKNLKRNQNRFQYRLSMGATLIEACLPYFRKSVHTALKPTIASVATMGIVFLPGMMSGQIIGGQSPIVAIKYQIAIMIAIFSSTAMTLFLSLRMTIKKNFDGYGILVD